MSQILSPLYGNSRIQSAFLSNFYGLTLVALSMNFLFFITEGKASPSESYVSGQAFMETLKKPKDLDLSKIPGYSPSLPTESTYSHAELSEKASNLLHSKDKDSAGSVVLESAAQRPQFQIDPQTDPLFVKSNEILKDSEKGLEEEVVEGNVEELRSKNLHICEESVLHMTFVCEEKRLVKPKKIKKSQYHQTKIEGKMFRRVGRNYGAWSPYSFGPAWAQHDQDYSFYETRPPGTPVRKDYHDGCNNYWHRETPEFKDVDVLEDNPLEDEIVGNCEALEAYAEQGFCHYQDLELIEGKKEKEVTQENLTVKIQRDWWHRRLTYVCEHPSKNNCKVLRDQGCTQIASECKEKIGDRCVVWQQTYECVSEKGTLKKTSFSGLTPFCLGGDCVDQTWDKNTDFGKAIAHLAALQEMGQDMNAVEGTLFKGLALSCAKHCADFTDCCRKGKGKGWGISSGLSKCTKEEDDLAEYRGQDKCVYVGTYCAEKVWGTCIRKKSTYCCFESKLARLMHEGGRRQLGIGWGEARNPNCRAFTIDEITQIDFSKIDFMEVFGDLGSKSSKLDPQKFMTQFAEDFQKKLPTPSELTKNALPKELEMQGQIRERQKKISSEKGDFTLHNQMEGETGAELVY